MIIKPIEGAQHRLGKEQGYLTLPVRHEYLPGLGDTLTSSWQPTPKEIEAIMAGAPIYLTLLSITHPPCLLTVGPVPEPVPVPEPLLESSSTQTDMVAESEPRPEPEPVWWVVCKHGLFYLPGSQGCTRNIEKAGLFTFDEAWKESHPNGNDGPRDEMFMTRFLSVPAGCVGYRWSASPTSDVRRVYWVTADHKEVEADDAEIN